ncbi:hypothetical protein LCGC14_2273510 [marine sediment metagenome]|uniref:Uncharacterized protein n=1 Tax=marine sediment metagenome TaxID=412755 RepID=A0A0F9F8T4_9ZZZZ
MKRYLIIDRAIQRSNTKPMASTRFMLLSRAKDFLRRIADEDVIIEDSRTGKTWEYFAENDSVIQSFPYKEEEIV